MAYTTGSASSLANLLTAIQNACTANGWTLGSGVLNRGACHTKLEITGNDLTVLGGLNSALDTPGPSQGHIGASAVAALAMTFPATYHIHILGSPDEVYVLVNYAINQWQWLAFGCTPAPGLPGTGAWYSASNSKSPFARNGVYLTPALAGAYSGSRGIFAQNWTNATNSYIHHGLDGFGWSPLNVSPSGAGAVDAWGAAQGLIASQPNMWNGESILIPIYTLVSRASSKVSMASTLAHARYVRNDNFSDGEIITLGPDQWKTYPFSSKNSAGRDAGNGVNHSGTFGHAIRYDGP